MSNNLFKIEYSCTNGKTFRTIANTDNVEIYMNDHYNMSGITGYSAKPTIKLKYKKFVNKIVNP